VLAQLLLELVRLVRVRVLGLELVRVLLFLEDVSESLLLNLKPLA
jgi:hypothetical protein